jgi:acyl-CoA reductase-like NAD-dependent aldehyde dehydrogenase
MTVEATMTIDGKPVVSSEWIDVRNPARLSELVGRYPNGTAQQADAAVSAAAAALPAWRRLSAEDRAAALLQALGTMSAHVNDWAALLTAENGKTLAESMIDFQITMMGIGYYAGHPEWLADEVLQDDRRRLVVQKQPIGVCVAIIPWNFPPTLASVKIGPGLLAGNTMVIKVPEFGPLATLQCLGAIAAALPPGVLNIVSGFGPEVGTSLVRDKRVGKVAFTGSTATGKLVMADAASHLARVTLELGGNDAALVLHDVDITEEMVKRIVTGAFSATGQICFAIKRLYVHESRYGELTERLRAAVDEIVVGDGARPEVTMGPFNNERQFVKVGELLAETQRDYDVAQLGSYAEGTAIDDGYFMLPYLVFNPPESSAIVSCEQMGPILPIMKFEDEEEAIARANDSEYGLASSVWSTDIDRAFAIGERLEAGTTFVNGHSLFTIDPDGPFGGFKESGVGREFGGPVGLAQYIQLKSITDSHL